MALIHCSFFSKSLLEATDLNVIIPTFDSADIGTDRTHHPENGFKTLFLLHGMYGNYGDWERFTGIEAYAQAKDLAVVMPSAANSFYADMVNGGKYYTYISEEVPAFVRSMFHLSDRREDNYIAGLSMGGYGAWKIALNHPDQYSHAASLSGALDIKTIYSMALQQNFPLNVHNIWTDPKQIEETDSDLLEIMKKLSSTETAMPKLFQACGKEDPLYPINTAVRDAALNMGMDLTFVDGPGSHQWEYWDRNIKKVLEWLPL